MSKEEARGVGENLFQIHIRGLVNEQIIKRLQKAQRIKEKMTYLKKMGLGLEQTVVKRINNKSKLWQRS